MINLPNNWRVVRYRQIKHEHFAYIAKKQSKLITIRAFGLEALKQSLLEYAEKHKPFSKATSPAYEWYLQSNVGDQTTLDCFKDVAKLRWLISKDNGQIKTYSFMQFGTKKYRITIIAK